MQPPAVPEPAVRRRRRRAPSPRRARSGDAAKTGPHGPRPATRPKAVNREEARHASKAARPKATTPPKRTTRSKRASEPTNGSAAEPSPEVQAAVDAKAGSEAEPATDVKLAATGKPAADDKPIAEVKPVAEESPVADDKPAAEDNPVAEDRTAANGGPAAEPEPVVAKPQRAHRRPDPRPHQLRRTRRPARRPPCPTSTRADVPAAGLSCARPAAASRCERRALGGLDHRRCRGLRGRQRARPRRRAAAAGAARGCLGCWRWRLASPSRAGFSWCVLFLLVAYIPDALVGPRAAYVLMAVGARRARCCAGSPGASAFRSRASCSPSRRSLLAYGIAAFFASRPRRRRRRDARPGQLTAVVALLMLLLDYPRVAAARGLGGGRGRRPAGGAWRSSSSSLRTSASTYGGFAGVLPDGDALRSAGPLNPNTFGQVLATSAVLAFYLACMQTRRWRRGCSPAAIAVACAVGVVYSQSRAALVALAIGALAIGAAPRRARCACSPPAACAAVVARPASCCRRPWYSASARSRDLVTTDPVALQDTALRGRASREPRRRPDVGATTRSSASARTTSRSTTWATPRRSGSTRDPSSAGAHNLYLESLAETGVLGALAFFACSALALSGAWRARSRLGGRDALLGEGLFVALGVFLITALTLQQRLRALPVDLPRPRPRRRAPGAGGRRDDGRAVFVALGRAGGVGLRRLSARARAAGPAASAPAAAGAAASCRCRSSSPRTTRPA